MVLSMYSVKDGFVYPHLAYCESIIIFQILWSLFVVMHAMTLANI